MTADIGYVRQSRESQAGASPEAQRRAIEQFSASQGWTHIDTLADLGRSGFDPKVKRPALEELLAIVDQGGVDRVVVWKLDRLTRRGIREALEIVDRIERGGAALVSVTEPFDTSTALGQGIFALLLSLAQAESEKLAERVKSGKSVVRARGGWMGGPVPLGFSVERVERDGYTESRLVLNENAPLVRSMVDDVLAGKSVRSLVAPLNASGVAPPRGGEWNHATIMWMLRNPVLAGYLPDGHGGVIEDCGEALVTPDEWRELSKRMTPKKGRRAQVPSLLGGIAVCAGCGTTMGGESTGPHPNYKCQRATGGRVCAAPARVPMKQTDEYVLEHLGRELRRAIADFIVRGEKDRGRLLDRVARWWTLREGRQNVGALMNERDDVDASLARLREAFVAGDFTADPEQYRNLLDRLTARRDALTVELDTTLPTPAVVARPDFVESLDFDTKRDLVKLLLRVECVKAGRPGIKFVPDERLRLSLVLDWNLVVRIADAAWENATPEEREAAIEELRRVEAEEASL